MTKSALLLATVLAFTATAQAQTAVSPQKQQLVEQTLQAMQPIADQIARQLVEQPAIQLLQRNVNIMRRNVPADQHQTVGQAMQSDARTYFEGTFPGVRDRARSLVPSTIGSVLTEKLTEAELQEVLAVFRSDAWKKFQSLVPDANKALADKLVPDVRAQVESNLKTLDQTMAKRLGLTPPAGASGAAGGK